MLQFGNTGRPSREFNNSRPAAQTIMARRRGGSLQEISFRTWELRINYGRLRIVNIASYACDLEALPRNRPRTTGPRIAAAQTRRGRFKCPAKRLRQFPRRLRLIAKQLRERCNLWRHRGGRVSCAKKEEANEIFRGYLFGRILFGSWESRWWILLAAMCFG